MKRLIIAFGMIVGLFASTGLASENYPIAFEHDSDVNGYVTREEAKVRFDLDQIFKEIDLDHDGKLNIVEYQEYESGGFEPPYETEYSDLGGAPLE